MILPFLYMYATPKFLLIGIGIRQSWLQKYQKLLQPICKYGKIK